MSAFKPGQTYRTRSIVDSDSWFSIEVLRRTAKTLTARVAGKTKVLRIGSYDGAEVVKPYGTYSMCPVISAKD